LATVIPTRDLPRPHSGQPAGGGPSAERRGPTAHGPTDASGAFTVDLRMPRDQWFRWKSGILAPILIRKQFECNTYYNSATRITVHRNSYYKPAGRSHRFEVALDGLSRAILRCLKLASDYQG
jgi:hypothetical protein